MPPRQGNNPFGHDPKWKNPYHQKRSEREPPLPDELRQAASRSAEHRHRRRTPPGPTECPVVVFEGQEQCKREKPPYALVCDVCAKAICIENQGRTWFQLWLMEFIGEGARRSALADARARRAQAQEKRRAEVGSTDVVYYVRTAPSRVKVGYTSDIARRLREYRSDESYLLAIEPGGRDLEQQRHHELRKWRVNRRREDYAEGPEVTDRINAVLAEHGDPRNWIAAHRPDVEESA